MKVSYRYEYGNWGEHAGKGRSTVSYQQQGADIQSQVLMYSKSPVLTETAASPAVTVPVPSPAVTPGQSRSRRAEASILRPAASGGTGLRSERRHTAESTTNAAPESP